MAINEKTFCFKYIILAILSAITFNACNENSGEPELGEEYIESNTNIISIDTFSVEFSTIIFDNLITSGSETILLGNYEDNYFGKISSKSYFQLGIPGNDDIREDDLYDSLCLVLSYNKYSFGDTTETQEIFVYQLIENIVYDATYFIHDSTSFEYNPIPIGSLVYKPEPNSTSDTISIKISDEIGLDLFTKLENNSEKMTDDDSFVEYFHGLMLAAGDECNASIIGFKAYDNEVKLKLYTTRDAVPTEEIIYQFGIYNNTKQFNNITHDFSSTSLNSLDDPEMKLSTIETDGLGFLQGGIGVAIRVDFPTINEILLFNRGAIVEAQLFVAPLENSYSLIDLPEDIIAYKADNINRISEEITTPVLNIDDLYNEKTAYSFDLTKYFNDQINESYFYPGKGIIITLPVETSMGKTFKRMIMDSKNKMTKLKIYYLTY